MAFESPLGGLLHAARALRHADVGFALVEGLAIAVRGEPRFTADIDLVVDVDSDATMEALVFRLRDAGFTLRTLVPHPSSAPPASQSRTWASCP